MSELYVLVNCEKINHFQEPIVSCKKKIAKIPLSGNVLQVYFYGLIFAIQYHQDSVTFQCYWFETQVDFDIIYSELHTV